MDRGLLSWLSWLPSYRRAQLSPIAAPDTPKTLRHKGPYARPFPIATGARGPLVFRAIYISTADPRYAQGRVDDNRHTCYAFAFFLKRPTQTSETWKVIGEFPDSVVECSNFRELPKSVVRDFKLEDARPGKPLGPC